MKHNKVDFIVVLVLISHYHKYHGRHNNVKLSTKPQSGMNSLLQGRNGLIDFFFLIQRVTM